MRSSEHGHLLDKIGCGGWPEPAQSRTDRYECIRVAAEDSLGGSADILCVLEDGSGGLEWGGTRCVYAAIDYFAQGGKVEIQN